MLGLVLSCVADCLAHAGRRSERVFVDYWRARKLGAGRPCGSCRLSRAVYAHVWLGRVGRKAITGGGGRVGGKVAGVCYGKILHRPSLCFRQSVLWRRRAGPECQRIGSSASGHRARETSVIGAVVRLGCWLTVRGDRARAVGSVSPDQVKGSWLGWRWNALLCGVSVGGSRARAGVRTGMHRRLVQGNTGPTGDNEGKGSEVLHRHCIPNGSVRVAVGGG